MIKTLSILVVLSILSLIPLSYYLYKKNLSRHPDSLKKFSIKNNLKFISERKKIEHHLQTHQLENNKLVRDMHILGMCYSNNTIVGLTGMTIFAGDPLFNRYYTGVLIPYKTNSNTEFSIVIKTLNIERVVQGYKKDLIPGLEKYQKDDYFFEFNLDDAISDIKNILKYTHKVGPIQAQFSNSLLFLYREVTQGTPLTREEFSDIYRISQSLINNN